MSVTVLSSTCIKQKKAEGSQTCYPVETITYMAFGTNESGKTMSSIISSALAITLQEKYQVVLSPGFHKGKSREERRREKKLKLNSKKSNSNVEEGEKLEVVVESPLVQVSGISVQPEPTTTTTSSSLSQETNVVTPQLEEQDDGSDDGDSKEED